MLVRPADMPTAEEMRKDSVLMAIVNWKDPQMDEPKRPQDPMADLTFVEEHSASFFRVMKESFALMK